MNFNQYTLKSQEAIQQAQQIASANGNPTIDTGHLLKALLEVDENVVPFLLKKLNVNLNTLSNSVNKIVDGYPKTSGGSAYLSNELNQTFNKSLQLLKDFKDEFVSVEHLMLALISN
ncbi:MAG: ATP-dependent chaperone ClpB, partial [Bacteroidota bacterium]